MVEEVYRSLEQLRRDVAILIVEHHLDLVLSLADRAYVLEDLEHAPATAAPRLDIVVRATASRSAWLGRRGQRPSPRHADAAPPMTRKRC